MANNYIRLHEGVQGEELQIAAHLLLHRETASQIVAFAMIHTADAAFFKSVADLAEADRAKGAEIHHEQIRDLTPKEVAANAPVAAMLHGVLELRRKNQRTFAASFNGVSQFDVFRDKENWHRSDISVLQML